MCVNKDAGLTLRYAQGKGRRYNCRFRKLPDLNSNNLFRTIRRFGQLSHYPKFKLTHYR